MFSGRFVSRAIRLGIALLCSILLIGAGWAQNSAGAARFVRTTDPSFDVYTNSPSLSTQEWLRQHFWWMLVYSPYFDSRLSWYPNGYVYLDVYAIYTGSTLAAQHPDWILKDASGNKLYIPWGCSNNTCPQYAADTANTDFRSYWIGQASALVAAGYKGLFLDDVNMNFTVSDGNGNFVNPIDSSTGVEMTWDAWRDHMASFTEQVRAAFPATQIVHNSVWFAGPSGVRDQDPYIKRQIAAANHQFIEFGVNDGGLTGGTGIWSLNSLLDYLDRVHTLNNGVVLSGVATDPVGREYALANYFLISTGNDGLGNTSATPDNWWTGFEVDLGSPASARTLWNNLWRRDFSGGMVLVNPPQSASITVTLPGTYKRIGGTTVNSITLGAKEGAVLLLNATPPPDTQAPQASITSPADGATVSGVVTVTASAVDNVAVTAVDFYVDNVFQGSSATTPYLLPWSTTTTADGPHTLKATAKDAAGNQGTSATISVTVANTSSDTTAPIASITSPANGATVSGNVNITASASDNVGVTTVDFYVDNVLRGTDAAAPYNLAWSTTSVANGSHTLKGVAKDAAGNQGTSAAISVIVANPVPDTIAPTVSITSPAAGATVSGTVNIAADASDNVSVKAVDFYVDNVLLGTDTSAPFSQSWPTTTIANGAHSLKAVARDAAGNQGTSAVVGVTVANQTADRTPPTVKFISPAPGAVSGVITISASAQDNVGVIGVKFFLDDVQIAPEVTTSTNGVYSLSWDSAALTGRGGHMLKATARDAAGNTASAQVQIRAK